MLEWLTTIGPSFLWLVLLILFMVAEALTVGLTSIWFAVGALGALITSFFVDNIWIEAIVFLALSFVCLLAVRPLARKYIHPKRVATNADRVIGAEGVVTLAIDNLRSQGQVTVRGNVWTARAETDEGVIPEGETVRVLRIEGVKIIVAPL